jgi:hypothetical protein
MKQIFLSFVITLTMSQCTENRVRPITDEALTIRSGTSFGMCIGYCQMDYTFNGTNVTFTQSGTRSQNETPTKTCQAAISPADWNAIKALADFDAFSKVPTTLGCPDCADGGAEYIELQAGDSKHRVTFEFNNTIQGFEPLVDALRKARESAKDCK